jgi:cytosine/adenosine deaminase-related metal-dependent hydrolase
MTGMSLKAREGCTVIRNARIGSGGLGSIVLGGDGSILAAPGAMPGHSTPEAGSSSRPRPSHAHLDRAFGQAITGVNLSGTLSEAIGRFHRAIGLMTVDALAAGAKRALRMLETEGVGHVRTHTIVGGDIGFRAWEAVESAASGFPAVQVRQVVMPLAGSRPVRAPGDRADLLVVDATSLAEAVALVPARQRLAGGFPGSPLLTEV